MHELIKVGSLSVDVVRKNIKNMHLNVHPPVGAVTVSAPLAARFESIRLFVISNLVWIRQKQAVLAAQPRESEREYVARESHYLWGRRCLLHVVYAETKASVSARPGKITLTVRKSASKADRAEALELWYRELVRAQAGEFIDKWAPKMGVKVSKVFVQHMKTRWGSANKAKMSLRLNTELARKPRECLEYIVIHELAHLIVPDHSAAFFAIMDRHLPNWPTIRDRLNRLPVSHEEWAR